MKRTLTPGKFATTMLVFAILASSPPITSAQTDGGGDPDDGNLNLILEPPAEIYIGDTLDLIAAVNHPDGDDANRDSDVNFDLQNDAWDDNNEPLDDDYMNADEAAITQWTPDADDTGSNTFSASVSGDYNPNSKNATITVKTPVIDQLTKKPGRFPVCQNANVVKNDFTFDTAPHRFVTNVEVKEFSPDKSATPGEHTATFWIVVGDNGLEASKKTVDYTVLPLDKWHEYKTYNEFDAEAQTRTQQGYTDSDTTDDYYVSAPDGTPVAVYSDIQLLVTYYAKQQGSNKDADGNSAISVGQASVDSVSQQFEISFNFEGAGVSYTAAWQHSNTTTFNTTVGSNNDPKGHWIVGYQNIANPGIQQVVRKPGGAIYDSFTILPDDGPTKHFFSVHSTKCNP